MHRPDQDTDIDILDRIDEIAPPGTDLNRDATNYEPPELTNKALCRR